MKGIMRSEYNNFKDMSSFEPSFDSIQRASPTAHNFRSTDKDLELPLSNISKSLVDLLRVSENDDSILKGLRDQNNRMDNILEMVKSGVLEARQSQVNSRLTTTKFIKSANDSQAQLFKSSQFDNSRVTETSQGSIQQRQFDSRSKSPIATRIDQAIRREHPGPKFSYEQPSKKGSATATNSPPTKGGMAEGVPSHMVTQDSNAYILQENSYRASMESHHPRQSNLLSREVSFAPKVQDPVEHSSRTSSQYQPMFPVSKNLQRVSKENYESDLKEFSTGLRSLSSMEEKITSLIKERKAVTSSQLKKETKKGFK